MAATLPWFFLREPQRTRLSGDGIGLALMAIGLGSLQYVLQSGERYDWFSDARIVTFSIIGIVGTAAFVIWELAGTRDPIVDIRVLGRRPVAVGSALSLGIGFTLFVGIVLGPQFSQAILGFTATLSGNQVLVRAVSIAAIIPVAVMALTRLHVRPKYLLAAGFALVGWSGFLSATVKTTTADFWSFGTALAVGGFGFGLLFVPLSVAELSSVPPALGTKASAMLSIFQQFRASLSTALMVTIIDRRAAFHLDQLASEINLRNASVAALQATHASLNALTAWVQLQATTLGFADAYIVSGIAGLALVPLAFLLPAQDNTMLEVQQ